MLSAESGERFTAAGARMKLSESRREDDAPVLATVSRAQMRDEILRDLEWLRPVQLPAPPKVKLVRAPSQCDAVAGDFHFPLEDERSVDIFLQAVADKRPRRVILNGDLPDLLAVSRFPKDARPTYTWSLGDEQRHYAVFLKRLHDVTASFGAEIIETDANHSGNSLEGRWWRYLSDRCPELLTLPDAEAKLSYQSWWYPPEEWCRVELREYVEIVPGFIALHGDMARGKAAYTAAGMLDKWKVSLIHNHTHRFGFTVRRVPGIGGRGEGQLRGYENACMCSIKPHYSSMADWQNGFSFVHWDDDGEYNVEQVLIERGRAVIGSLGRTYRAAA